MKNNKKTKSTKKVITLAITGSLLTVAGAGTAYYVLDDKANSIDESINLLSNIKKDIETVRQELGDKHSSPIVNSKTDVVVPVDTNSEDLKNLIDAKDTKGNKLEVSIINVDTSKEGVTDLVANVKDNTGNKTTVIIPIKVEKESEIQSKEIDAAPVVMAYDITIDFGANPDFSIIEVNDDKDKNLEVNIVGNYNNKVAGIYPMSAVAIDSAGNSSSVNFNLIVKEHPLQAALDVANENVNEKDKQLKIAQKYLDDANDLLIVAKANLDDLLNLKENTLLKYFATQEKINELEEKYEQAKENVNLAKQKYDEAVIKASQSQEFLDLKKTLDDTTKEYMETLGKKTSAENNVIKAKDELQVAIDILEDKKEELAQKTIEKNNADIELENAQSALEIAQQELSNSLNDNSEAQANYDQALLKLDEAKNNQIVAQEQLDKANESLLDADKNIQQAREALALAEQKVKDAQAVIDLGSVGFFNWHDDNTLAEEAIEYGNEKVSNWKRYDLEEITTHVGRKDDATSLENMAKTFDLLKEANQLAANDPNNTDFFKTQRYVTDYAMATAQVNANVSATTTNHSGIYNVSENLAWGYSSRSPFVGWYDREKLVWEYFQKNPNATSEDAVKDLKLPPSYIQTSHYVTLTGAGKDDTYVDKEGKRVMGMGINTEIERYNTTHSHTFVYWQNEESDGKVYTVEEYEKDFYEYYNKVQNDLAQAIKEKEEAENKLNSLLNNDGLSQEDKQLLDDLQKQLDNAKQEVTNAENKIQEANEYLEQTNSDVSNKQNNLDEANNNLQEAKSSQEAIAKELISTQEEINNQEDIIDQKQNELDLQNSELESINNDLSEKEDTINQLNEKLNELNNEVAKFSDEVSKTQQEQSEIEDELELNNNQLSEDEKQIDDLEKQITEQEEDIERVNQDIETKTQELDSKQKEYESAVEERDRIIKIINGEYAIEYDKELYDIEIFE